MFQALFYVRPVGPEDKSVHREAESDLDQSEQPKIMGKNLFPR